MNPFAAKAAKARALYEHLAGYRSARDVAMERSFPLGAGFGRPGRSGERRIEATVSRAVKIVDALKRAEWLEAQARAFDAGTINAQGRSVTMASRERSESAEKRRDARAQRIEAARRSRGDLPAWAVTSDVYADGSGYLAGSGRKLVKHDHREAVEKAISGGMPVPPAVLAEYPDLVV